MQKSAAEARNKNKSGICFDYAPSVRSSKQKAPAASPKGSGESFLGGGGGLGAFVCLVGLFFLFGLLVYLIVWFAQI